MAQKRVLIADDNPLLLHLARSRLCEAGYDVVTARDGIEALEHVRDRPPDLIFLGGVMPGLSGFATLRRLKAGPHAAIPVVIISALMNEKDVARALGAGAAAYLARPFATARLVQLAETHLAPTPV